MAQARAKLPITDFRYILPMLAAVRSSSACFMLASCSGRSAAAAYACLI